MTEIRKQVVPYELNPCATMVNKALIMKGKSMKNVQKEKGIKRREIDQKNLKGKVRETPKMQTRDQQMITLDRLIASSVPDMTKLMLKKTVARTFVHALIVAKGTTK